MYDALGIIELHPRVTLASRTVNRLLTECALPSWQLSALSFIDTNYHLDIYSQTFLQSHNIAYAVTTPNVFLLAHMEATDGPQFVNVVGNTVPVAAASGQRAQSGFLCSTSGEVITDRDTLKEHYTSDFHRWVAV